MDDETFTVTVPVECYVQVTEDDSAEEIVKAALETDARIYLVKVERVGNLIAR
jgi:hypothetical protein